jgi:hypothetical protein
MTVDVPELLTVLDLVDRGRAERGSQDAGVS